MQIYIVFDAVLSSETIYILPNSWGLDKGGFYLFITFSKIGKELNFESHSF